ncbi:MAG: hypothetical protein JOY70_07940 [Acidisphaera sp.]|nr:hypothetical protein [Acidisphaera sp.]
MNSAIPPVGNSARTLATGITISRTGSPTTAAAAAVRGGAPGRTCTAIRSGRGPEASRTAKAGSPPPTSCNGVPTSTLNSGALSAIAGILPLSVPAIVPPRHIGNDDDRQPLTKR